MESVRATGAIEEVNLLAIPVALNFDEKPGPDGFVLKVYAGNRRQPQPIPIESGTLEILMYDGIWSGKAQDPILPRHVWRYGAGELKRFEVQTSIGVGYQIAAPWGDDKPTGNCISVVVRYLSPSGHSVPSAPSVISITGQ